VVMGSKAWLLIGFSTSEIAGSSPSPNVYGFCHNRIDKFNRLHRCHVKVKVKLSVCFNWSPRH
jgi:hypothetical protein